VTRDELDEPAGAGCAATVVALVDAALPPPTWDNVHRQAIEKLLPQALAAAEAAERFGVGLEGLAAILTVVGEHLKAGGAYAEAEPLFRRALAVREQVLGPEHPDLATSLHKLAYVCDVIRRSAEAESLYRRTLAVREQALDPEHLWSRRHWATSASFSFMLAATPRPNRCSGARSTSASGH
jgi:hypothetical protein